jgi:hypothetical protein
LASRSNFLAFRGRVPTARFCYRSEKSAEESRGKPYLFESARIPPKNSLHDNSADPLNTLNPYPTPEPNEIRFGRSAATFLYAVFVISAQRNRLQRARCHGTGKVHVRGAPQARTRHGFFGLQVKKGTVGCADQQTTETSGFRRLLPVPLMLFSCFDTTYVNTSERNRTASVCMPKKLIIERFSACTLL